MEKELMYCDKCEDDVYPEITSYGNDDVGFGYEIVCSVCGNIIDED